MNIPNLLTISRVFLTPVFLLLYLANSWLPGNELLFAIVLFILFIYLELSDILDGHLARSWNQVTALGKVMDPFADVMCRLTYFLIFAVEGIMPVFFFALIIYREIGITFLRSLMFRRGIAVQANIWGKLKAVFYGVSGFAGMFVLIAPPLLGDDLLPELTPTFLLVIFTLAVVSSLASFMTYVHAFYRQSPLEKNAE
jgi:CDP-diacylglycerol--glycerol-3-phosphate 3-phosphatidyltransferase